MGCSPIVKESDKRAHYGIQSHTDLRLSGNWPFLEWSFSIRRDAACEELVLAFASSQRGFI